MAAVAAIGDGGGDEGAGGAAREGCKKGIAALCERMYECFTSAQLAALADDAGFSDAATCGVALADAGCPSYALAATNGTTVFHADRVTACEAAMATVACPDRLEELAQHLDLLEECAAVFEGKQARGGACSVSGECAESHSDCFRGVCTGTLNGAAYEQECSEPTVEDCSGRYCLTLLGNLQNMSGICSAQCRGHWECGEGGKCYRLTEEIQACLSTCESNTDCGGGFVCTAINADDKVCFVEVSPG